MRRKRIAQRLSEETVELIRDMHSRSESYTKISEKTGVSRRTVNEYVIAWNLGFDNISEYFDNRVRRNGYKDFSTYNQIRAMVNNPDAPCRQTNYPTMQQKFESDMKTGYNMDRFEGDLLDVSRGYDKTEAELVLYDAITNLKNGKVCNNLVTIGIGMARGLTLREIRERLNSEISYQAIHQKKDKLFDILSNNRKLRSFFR